MSKKIIILLILIIFSVSTLVNADEISNKIENITSEENSDIDPEDVPWELSAAKWLIDLANGSYNSYHEGFIDSITSVFNNIQENLAEIGRLLVGFVTVISIISKVDRFENFTFITVAPAFIFFGVGIGVINNIDVIFEALRSLVNSLSGGIGISEGGFISFDVILDSYNQAIASGGNRFVQFIIGAINSIIYTLFALVGLFAFIVALAVTLVVEIKIGLYMFISPIMFSGFGSTLTSRFSYGFIQGILKTHLELFYIQVVIAIFTALIANPSNAFVMTLIALIGVIIALLGGGRMVFSFLASRA